MRIGFIGPAENAHAELRQALEFLISDVVVDQVLYLGVDDAVTEAIRAWSEDLMQGACTPDAFLDRAVELACDGAGAAIEALLEADEAVRRLSTVHRLPVDTARAVDVLDGWILLAVQDKAILQEDDIANAHIIIYGEAQEAAFRRFGPRHFFTPARLEHRHVGVLEVTAETKLEIAVYDVAGIPRWSETLQGRAPKLVVSP